MRAHLTNGLGLLICLLTGSVFAQEACTPPAEPTLPEAPATRPAANELEWFDSLQPGYQQALAKNQPILVIIGGPGCIYCRLLEEELRKPLAQEELQRWTRVKLDVETSPDEARLMAVGPIPALRMLTPTGKVVISTEGARSAEEFVEWLQANREELMDSAAEMLAGTGPPDAFEVRKLIRLFRRKDATIREAAIQRLLPYPNDGAKEIVDSFADGPLSEQLCSLELLAEWKAPVEGLDPWQPATLSLEKLTSLTEWAEKTDHTAREQLELTEEELNSAGQELDKLLSATLVESRAIRGRLARYGQQLLPEVKKRLQTASTDGDRERLTALRYHLVAPNHLRLEWPSGLERLASRDVDERQKAAIELSKRITKAEEPLLLELFSDPAPLIRELSLRALKQIGGANVNSALIGLLDDADPNVRAAVLTQLAQNPSTRIVPKIAEYVKTEADPDLIVHAARLFREAKGKPAMDALIGLLDHESWQVRAEAIHGIGKIIDADRSNRAQYKYVYEKLMPKLDDDDGFVISRTIEALEHADQNKILEPIVEVATTHPELAVEVVRWISNGYQLREERTKHLREFCRNKEPQVRAAAIGGLCNFAPSDCSEELKLLFEDSESQVRTAAALAFFGLREQAMSSQSFDAATNEVIAVEGYDEYVPVPKPQRSPIRSFLGAIFGGPQSVPVEDSPTALPVTEEPLEIVRPADLPPAVSDEQPVAQPVESEPLEIGSEPVEVAQQIGPLKAPKPGDSEIDYEALANASGQNLEEYLQQVRNEKMVPEWMQKFVPTLVLLSQAEEKRERLAAALALAAMGHDEQALPVLKSGLDSQPHYLSMMSRSLPWLLWNDRIELYDQMISLAKSDVDLESILDHMAQTHDLRALPALWSPLHDEQGRPSASQLVTSALTQMIFHQSYWREDQFTTAQKKLASQELTVRSQQGSYWQRITALLMLQQLDAEQVTEFARELIADESELDDLRRDAFRMWITTQTEREATEIAVAKISADETLFIPDALTALTSGRSQLVTVAGGRLPNPSAYQRLVLNTSGLGSNGQQMQAIFPEAPEGLTKELLHPLLESSDSASAARAAYLLVLLGERDAFPILYNYWKSSVHSSAAWTRLVYRAISFLDDDRFIPDLIWIYENQLLPEPYSDSMKEFYWTIRIMTGPQILELRKRVRDEVGMDSLR